MSKIIKRIPEVAYAFTEIQFDSYEEYVNEYPKFLEQYAKFKGYHDVLNKLGIMPDKK